MNFEELNYDELLKMKPYDGDLVFNVNGMTADEYISKITEEMNKIDLSSVPIDRWDMVVTFALAILEVAGDFLIGDPSFKFKIGDKEIYSLANKEGPFCKWLKQFHDPQADSSEWVKKVARFLKHDDQSIDSQIFSGSKGEHRAKSLSHDLPMAYFKYRKKAAAGEKLSTTEKAYNATLIIHDIFIFFFSVWSLCSGKYRDFEWDKNGKFVPISDDGYNEYTLLVAVVKYALHMMADFCSSSSLPIPGWSLLSHFPDRDVEAFAMKLYRNGMNLRTMALQSVPVKVVELLMSMYIWIRSKGCDGEFSEAAWEHKKHKLLLISHGITTAVNVGKVVITHEPWRLNLIVIVRTFHLVWLVVAEEARLTNRHIETLDSGILKARIESCKTLILLDEAVYETENVDRILRILSQRMKNMSLNIDSSMDEVDSEFKAMLENIGG